MKRTFAVSAEISRWVIGLMFVVFGLNGFLNFMPVPQPSPEGGALLGALAATGYMFPLIKGTEVLAGLLILSERFAALGAILLAPVLVNIVLYHVALDSSGLAMSLGMSSLYALVVARRWSTYAPLIAGRGGEKRAPAPSRAAPRAAAA